MFFSPVAVAVAVVDIAAAEANSSVQATSRLIVLI